MPETGSRLGSSLSRRSCTVQSPVAAKAFFGLAPPPISEFFREADELAEVSELKGIQAAECFEIFGVPDDAPATSDSASTSRMQNREGLASCLATPSTFVEESSLGEVLNEHLRGYSAEQTRQVQARYSVLCKHELRESQRYAC